jgi:hypothetical protein
VSTQRRREGFIRWCIRKLFGVRGLDRWFFWKVGVRSKALRFRCRLLGGHRYEWMKLHGGGFGHDALMCNRCHCSVKEYRSTQL